MNETPATTEPNTVQGQVPLFISSPSIGKLAEALAKAQGQIEGAKKDSANPFFHSKYADLASVWDACRKPLSDNGLAVIQLPGRTGEGLFVDSILTHSSGEWISSRLFMQPVQDTPQGIGSAVTYARRYGLQSIVGIAPEDDDGNDASGKKGNAQTGEAINRRQATRENDAQRVRSEAGDKPPREIPPSDPGAVSVHFGKNKGLAVAEMNSKQLAWYHRNYESQVAEGKRTSAADKRLYEAIVARMEAMTMNQAPPVDDGDAIPGLEASGNPNFPFNGAHHKNLEGILEFNQMPLPEFMDAMKWGKLIPETATNFMAMSDETAGKFTADFDNVLDVWKRYQEREK